MDTNIFISIVVPVYNVEPFIEECIGSILAQTHANWECILINDGSTDRSGALCDIYAQQDDRISVIHQRNRGVTYARYQGVKQAKGDYITFVDSDDHLPFQALALMASAVDVDTDVVIGYIEKSSQRTYKTCVNSNTYREMLITGKNVMHAPFCKLFKKELFSDFVFDIPREVVIGEDYLMNLRVAFNARNNITFINEKVYCYRCGRAGSATTDFISSLGYQKIMYEEIIRSVPTLYITRYKGMIVHNMVKVFIRYIERIRQVTEDDYAYGRYLINEIKNTSHQLSVVEKLLLNYHCAPIRKILLFIFDVHYKVKHKFNI